MGERWVCKRCFTSNEGTAGGCTNCGLARGSEIPANDAWTPPAARPEQRSRWASLLRFWWVPLLIIGAGSAVFFSAGRDDAGQIADAGDLLATDLRVADCFDLKDPDEELIEDVAAKPCAEVHEFEMFFVGSLPDGDFPAVDVMDTYILDNCIPAFGEYVGLSYEESVLDIYPLIPSEEGWNAGDQTVQCAVFHPTNDELTGSLRDSER